MFTDRLPRRFAVVSPLALALMAGVAQAVPYNWLGTCGPNWFDVCDGGICNVNQTLRVNNFGMTNCTFNPGFPGGGDQIFLGSNSVNLNGTASVASISLNAGGVLNWLNGDLNVGAGGFAMNGTLNVTGGDRSIYNTITATGTVYYDGSIWYFQSASLINEGITTATRGDWRNWTGVNQFNNAGTFRKTTAADMNISPPTTSSGTIDVQEGRLFLTGTSFAFAKGSVTQTAAGSDLRLRNCAVSGRISGVSNGYLGHDATISIPADQSLNLNVTGNGYEWSGGEFQANGRTLTNMVSGKMSITGGDRSFYNGTLVNQGLLNHTGNILYFQTCALQNTGTLDVANGDWRNWTGTNSLTMGGLVKKTSVGDWASNVPTTLTGTLDVLGGRMFVSGQSFVANAGSLMKVAAGAELRFRNLSLGGAFTVQNSGFCGQDAAMTLIGNLSLNATINGWQWTGGDLQCGAFTLTNAPSGRLYITGGDRSIYNATLINNGFFSHAANVFYFQTCAMTNGGTMEISSGDWRNWTGVNSFTLSPGAILRKVPTASDWSMQVPSSFAGAIQAQGNNTYFHGTQYVFQPTSTVTVSNGASVRFRNAAISGTVSGVNSGYLGNDAAISLGGPLTLNVTGNGYESSGGDVQHGGNTMIIQAGSKFTLVGGDRSAFNGATVNNGDFIGNAGVWYFQTHALTNNATITMNSGDWRNWTGTNSFQNNGALNKVGAANAGIGVPTTNTGAISVTGGNLGLGAFTQTGGSFTLNGGTCSSGSAMQLNGGTFTGAGACAPMTNNGASVHVTGAGGAQIAALNLGGQFVQNAGGTLFIDISGGTTFDTITSSGSPVAGGTLRVNILGGYDPVSKSFAIVTGTQPAFGHFPNVIVTGSSRFARAGASGNNLVVYFPCQPADIGDDQGNAPPKPGIPNSGVNEGDYNAFFSGFFDAAPQCNIADDQGNPVPPGVPEVPNSGVNEGDYNLFFQLFFNGC